MPFVQLRKADGVPSPAEQLVARDLRHTPTIGDEPCSSTSTVPPGGSCSELAKVHTSADRRDVGYQLVERQVTVAQVGHVRGAGGPERAFLVQVGSVSDRLEHLVD